MHAPSNEKNSFFGTRKGIVVLFFLAVTLLISSNCNPGYAAQAVTIKKVQGIYYMVDINLETNSHYEVGRQYAEQIKANVPDYEARVDSFLNCMQQMLGLDFATLRDRAFDISKNVPPEYMEEIKGMQSVFSYTTDRIGDGHLSQNKLLVFELFADVARLSGCSASAVFGNSSSTGKTIIARNLEWHDLPHSYLQATHAVVHIRNENKSLCSFTFLGMLGFISAVSDDKIFAALLDTVTDKPYPSTAGKRSYIMDLRYALENETTLKGIADYMSNKDYAYSHIIFLADENSAFVLENDIGSPSRGLRSATSTLEPGLTWDHPNAIVTVNNFVLPGNAEPSLSDEDDTDRWKNFSTLYDKFLSNNGKVDVDKIKQIAGYYGENGTCATGAVFRPRDHYPSMQLIIMRMDTLETWVAFAPTGPQPSAPTYINVFKKNPFQEQKLRSI